jgi:hypothetical protein
MVHNTPVFGVGDIIWVDGFHDLLDVMKDSFGSVPQNRGFKGEIWGLSRCFLEVGG